MPETLPVTPSHAKPYAGIFPIAPTPFTDAGEVDIAGQRRVLDCMVDQGVDGICILANYSEQFLLTDAERNTLLDVCMSHVAGRVPVIVTTSHFSTQIAADRSRAAAAAGAAMLMVMPPYHGATLRADEKGIVEHFARVADAARIPIMVQDAPLSGVNLVGAVSGPARARGARWSAISRSRCRLGGQAAQPDRSRRRNDRRAVRRRGVDHADGGPRRRRHRDDAERPPARPHQAGLRASPCGRRKEAAAAYARILPLINYENRQCGLRATKTVMAAGGVIASDAVRHPLERLHPATKAGLLELAGEVDPLALRWGK